MLPALSVAETLIPIRLGDIERGTVAVSRPERSVVLSATNGDVAFLRAEIVAAGEAGERVGETDRDPCGRSPARGRSAGGVPSTSTTRSTRVRLLAASSAIVVTVWRPSAMPVKS